MSFASIARLFMSAFYGFAGLIFLFTNVFADRITEHRTLIGAVLLGYGIMRFVMWRRSHKNQQNEQV